MLEFLKRRWIFFVLTVSAVFFIFFAQNIFLKSTEILSQIKFFQASLTTAPVEEAKLEEPNYKDEPPQEFEPAPAPAAEELNLKPLTQQEIQEQLDDITEKIDILKQEVAELTGNPVAKQIENTDLEITDIKADVEEKEETLEKQEPLPQESQNNQQYVAPVVAVSSGSRPSYPKILISEVQAAAKEDKKQEFVELYNLNGFSVDLTGWYLQRKTAGGSSWSTYAPNGLFSNKIISANGYFLIAREGYYSGTADIFTDNSITEDNSFALKDPNGDISDKLGFGQAQDPELLSTVNPGAGQSIGRKVLSDKTEEETNNNLNDFELQTPTPKAENIVFVEPPIMPTDTTAPQVVFSLDAIQDSLSFAINFEISDILDVVTPSGVASYILKWQEQGLEWQEDDVKNVDGALENYSGTRDFTGEDGKIYYFQIKAKDVAGNESAWLPDPPVETKIEIPIPVEVKPIVINEIQTEGQTVKDEFVELYNPNEFEINLDGFALKRKTSGGKESNLVSSPHFLGIISAQGYFLIVPQDNDDGTPNYTGTVLPDLRYSVKGESIAKDNTVLLYGNDGIVIDKVGWGQALDCEGLCAPEPETSRSITRTGGVDSGDNSIDFVISDTPTPKAE